MGCLSRYQRGREMTTFLTSPSSASRIHALTVNPVAKIRKLETKRQIQSVISPDLSFNGKAGQGGFIPAGFVLPVLRTLPLSCRPTLRNVKRHITTKTKDKIMQPITQGVYRLIPLCFIQQPQLIKGGVK